MCIFVMSSMPYYIMRTLLFILFAFSLHIAGAADMKKYQVMSPSMQRTIDVNVITPDGEGPWPVMYLLHGWSDDCDYWPRIKPELPASADSLGIMIVMPSGHNSWYWDSPVNPDMKFETFISDELVSWTDSTFNTIPDRDHRMITGLSMGGQGALWNAVNHPDRFANAGSMSGGVDITYAPDKWNIKDALGDIKECPETWQEFRLPLRLRQIKDARLNLIITCGTEDFFYRDNEYLHQALLHEKVPHHFFTSPGGHTPKYWAELIDYHFLYFKNRLANNTNGR